MNGAKYYTGISGNPLFHIKALISSIRKYVHHILAVTQVVEF